MPNINPLLYKSNEYGNTSLNNPYSMQKNPVYQYLPPELRSQIDQLQNENMILKS